MTLVCGTDTLQAKVCFPLSLPVTSLMPRARRNVRRCVQGEGRHHQPDRRTQKDSARSRRRGRPEHRHSRDQSVEGTQGRQHRQVRLPHTLSHDHTNPYSCRLLDIVHADQKLYLVFEFLDVDLKRYMEHANTSGTPMSIEISKVRCHPRRLGARAGCVATCAPFEAMQARE